MRKSISTSFLFAVSVVSLSPSLTELAYEITAGQQVVGTTEFSDYPVEAKKIPRVGSYLFPSLEKIISLKPSLIIYSPEGQDHISERLKKTGVSLKAIILNRLSDMPNALSELGLIFQKTEQAKLKSLEWQKALESLNKASTSKGQNVLVQVDHEPFVFAGNETHLNDIILACGYKNPLASIYSSYPTLNRERALTTVADVVVVTAHIKSKDIKTRIEKFWKASPLPVKPRLIFANPDALSRVTFRLLPEAQKLCEEISK